MNGAFRRIPHSKSIRIHHLRLAFTPSNCLISIAIKQPPLLHNVVYINNSQIHDSRLTPGLNIYYTVVLVDIHLPNFPLDINCKSHLSGRFPNRAAFLDGNLTLSFPREEFRRILGVIR